MAMPPAPDQGPAPSLSRSEQGHESVLLEMYSTILERYVMARLMQSTLVFQQLRTQPGRMARPPVLYSGSASSAYA